MIKINYTNPFNLSNTFDSYNLNKIFDEEVFQKEYYPYQFDGWKEKKLYGLVDKKGNSIEPKIEFLKLNSNDNSVGYDNIFFVSDAFQELKKYYLGLSQGNSLKTNRSLYSNLIIYSGAKDSNQVYVNYINSLFNIFLNNFLTAEEKNNIKNINNFITIFINFLKFFTPITPLTKSSFMKHKNCDPAVSGLYVSLADAKKNADLISKINNYIQDENFNTFVESAKRFGFYVDRNFPWQIVADVESPYMVSVYQKYNLFSFNEVIDKCYIKIEEIDIDFIPIIIVGFWNNYVNFVKFSSEQKIVDKCNKLFGSINTLEKISLENFNLYFSENWVLRMYLFIKLLENKINIKQNIFENIYFQAIYLNKVVDKQNAVRYINNKISELTKKEKFEQLTSVDELVKLIKYQQVSLPQPSINF